MAGIGTLRETGLHAELKAWYARAGDEVEAAVDGYVVDLLRGETVIEIQTGHFSAIEPKLRALLASRPVRLVHPIAVERWIIQIGPDHLTTLSRRKPPRRGCAAQVFAQLVSFPDLLPDLPRPFTNRELGRALHQPAALAAQMTFCLRHMGTLSAAGKRGRASLHDLA